VTRPATAEAAPPQRDDLAVDRTALANERTLLAYLRTALQCVVAGVSLLKFFDDPVAAALGWTLLPFGVALTITGVVLYVRRRRRLVRTGGSGHDSLGL
jgi:putative membrane protein